jgi:hypothetical protein
MILRSDYLILGREGRGKLEYVEATLTALTVNPECVVALVNGCYTMTPHPYLKSISIQAYYSDRDLTSWHKGQ